MTLQSYRHVDIDLNELVDKQLTTSHVINIDTTYTRRMCVFNNKLYLPVYDINAIKTISLAGDRTETIGLQDINRPQSIHPLNSDQLVLASQSGLHLLDGTNGHFHDVYVQRWLYAGHIETWSEEDLRVECPGSVTTKKQFHYSSWLSISTLCLHEEYVFSVIVVVILYTSITNKETTWNNMIDMVQEVKGNSTFQDWVSQTGEVMS